MSGALAFGYVHGVEDDKLYEASLPSLDGDNLHILEAGTAIEVIGLTARPEPNGSHGILLTKNKATNRWNVQLHD